MKRLFILLLSLNTTIVCAQQNGFKSSPADYQWMNVGNEGFSAGASRYIRLAINPIDGQPYVAFSDSLFSDKATVMKFDGINWVAVGNTGFTETSAVDNSFAINSFDGQPYLAYRNDSRLNVMKYDGTNWVYVGNEGFAAGYIDREGLAFSPSCQLYIAYVDSALSSRITVKKFDGNNWINVGNAGFSPDKASLICISFNTSGQPFVAFRDYVHNDKVSVMKFDGTNWGYVGASGFSAYFVYYLTFTLSTSDQPYVAYQDCGNYQKATVMTFDGTDWVNVGNAGFSTGIASFTSLALNPSGEQPYMAYSDVNLYPICKATVMNFDGSWMNVGMSGFSLGNAAYISLVFNSAGEPCVAYRDGAKSNKVTVMKYAAPLHVSEPPQSGFLLYPNPAINKITIEVKETIPQGYLYILNHTGQRILQQEITEPTTTIDVSGLKSGVYIVKLVGEKGVEIDKFIKH